MMKFLILPIVLIHLLILQLASPKNLCDLKNNKVLRHEDVPIIRKVDLSNCSIILLASLPFRNNLNMVDLTLKDNKIVILKSDTFANMTSLELINLNNNRLSIIEEGTFDHLHKLSILLLSHNELVLSDIPTLVQGLSLFSLALDNNNPQVRDFKLDHTFGAKNMDILWLFNNSIQRLGSSVFKDLTKVRVILLNHNELEHLDDDAFRNNTNLGNLNLAHNRLTGLNVHLFETNRILFNLNLSHNRLRRLSVGTFSNQKKMHELRLENNQLVDLHENLLLENQELRIISLSNNMIKTLPPNFFKNNRQLRKVMLSNNSIENIDPLWFHFNDLSTLLVDGNDLYTFPLSAISHMDNLVCLNLGDNKLAELEPEYAKLKGLRRLAFHNNLINRLPNELFSVVKRDLTLYMALNPLKCTCINRQIAMAKNSTTKISKQYFSDRTTVTCIMERDQVCNNIPYGDEFYQWQELKKPSHNLHGDNVCNPF